MNVCYASGGPLGRIATAFNIRALEAKGFHGFRKADVCSGLCLTWPARDGSPQHNPRFPEPSFSIRVGFQP